MALRDILVRFGIEVGGKDQLDAVDKKLRKAKDSAGDLEKMLKKVGLAFLGKKVADFVLETIEMADALKHNAERLGLTTDELQKYQYVADVTGVSAQQAAVGLRFFNRAVGEAALGTKSATKVFAELGIAVRGADGQVRPTDELLFEFADKLKDVKSEAIRTALAMRTLGRGGASMLPMLQNGSAELRKYFKDIEELGGGFNETFVEQAHEVDYSIRRLKLGWRSIRVALVTELLPALTWLIDRVMKVTKVFIDASKHTLAFASSWRFLLGALAAGAIVWAALNAEMLPAYVLFGGLALAVLGLYLAFDDFYTFMQGQPSVLGDMLGPDGGAKFRADVQQILDLFGQLMTSIFGTKDGATSLAAGFEDMVGNSIPTLGRALIALIETLDTVAQGLKEIYQYGKIAFTWSFGSGSYNQVNKDISDQKDALDQGHAAWLNRANSLQGAWDDLGNTGAPRPNTRAPGGQVPGLGGTPSADELDPGAALNGRRRTTSGSDALNPGNMTVKIENTFHVAGNADPKTIGAAAANGTTQGLKDAASRDRDTYDAVTAGLLPLAGA